VLIDALSQVECVKECSCKQMCILSTTDAHCSSTWYACHVCVSYGYCAPASITQSACDCMLFSALMNQTTLHLPVCTLHNMLQHTHVCTQMLYVPTDWVHSIVNLGVNAQCNARSGATRTYRKVIAKCQPGRPPGQRPQQQQHMQPAS
jgi:hypothetical protein